MLDRTLFAPTVLDESTRARLRGRFDTIVRDLNLSEPCELLFRRSPQVGANAFALPSGAVVLTDEIVELAVDDDELVTVLAHELGHVAYRHALRQVLQSSTVALLTVALTNDAGTVSSAVATIPTLLVEMQFSREFEREADDFALAFLHTHAIDPAHFADLLDRLEGKTDGTMSFLSTHPSAAARAARFRRPSP